MKKIVFILSIFGFIALSSKVFAQDEKLKDKGKNESEEIIIRKKGDKDARITVEINGNKVIINGKPLSEFKDEDITINKRKMIIRDKNGEKAFDFNFNPGDFVKDFNWKSDVKEEPFAFLGVNTEESGDGAKIVEVTRESAAEKAGLKPGDIISKINDKKVEGSGSLLEAVRAFKPKEEITIYYKRDGKENTTRAVLGERKESNVMAFSFNGPDGMSRNYTLPRVPKMPNMKSMPNMDLLENGSMDNYFDFNGGLLPKHQKLGIKIQDTEDGNGVKVLEVDMDSPADKSGLKKDDIVTEVGGKKINNTDEARDQLHENQEKAAYSIKAKRNGTEMNFDIKIPKKLKTAHL